MRAVWVLARGPISQLVDLGSTPKESISTACPIRLGNTEKARRSSVVRLQPKRPVLDREPLQRKRMALIRLLSSAENGKD